LKTTRSSHGLRTEQTNATAHRESEQSSRAHKNKNPAAKALPLFPSQPHMVAVKQSYLNFKIFTKSFLTVQCINIVNTFLLGAPELFG
jgi:hypothetical protein